MGRVAACSRDDCSGSLAPLFDSESKEQDGYYCERCKTTYKDVETVNESLVGVEPTGRIDDRNELLEQKDKYEAILRQKNETLGLIRDLVADDKTELGAAIREALEGEAA